MNAPKIRRPRLQAFCCSVLLALMLSAGTSVAWAALAEPPTVLYYLIEMQRRSGKGCTGEAVTLPGLTPDRGLEDIAEAASQPGQTLSAVLTERGLGGKVFGARFSAPTPQAGVQFMKEKYCESVMHPGFTRIGGTKHDNQWVVLMAGDNAIPDPVLVAPDGSTATVPQGYTPLPGGQSVPPVSPADSPAEAVPPSQPLAPPSGPGSPAHPEPHAPRLTTSNTAPAHEGQPEGVAPLHAPSSVSGQPVPGQNISGQGTPDQTTLPGQATLPGAGTGSPALATPEQGGYVTSPTPQTDAEDIERARKRLGPDKSPTEALPAEPQVTGEYVYGPAR